MNAYRFTSGEDPSDEMLALIMKEVAQEAAASNREAADLHFAEMKKMIAANKAEWAERINCVING